MEIRAPEEGLPKCVKNQRNFTSELSWKLGHASILPVKSFLTMNISANFFQIAKSCGWQLLKVFIKLPTFDCNRAICVLLRGQNQLLVPFEGTSEERPENPPKNHKNPFRGRIESIKGAGKRFQKVVLEICPWNFLEMLIFVEFGLRKMPCYK